MKSPRTTITFFGLFIWLLATLFFFDEYFLRVFLGTIAKEIMQDFHLGIEQFSIMGAAYYVSYSIMQIPVGILADRFSIKYLLTGATTITALGTFQFYFAHSFFLGIVARLLIGFGSSFAFICLLVLTLNWFPQRHFGFFSGLLQFLGGIGPFLAGAPLALLLSTLHGNWRVMLLGVAVFTLILSFLIAIFLEDKPKGESIKLVFIKPKEPLFQRLLKLFRNRQVWWIILVAGTSYVPLAIIGAFWGTTYLETRGFSKITASTISSSIWIGAAISYPIVGRLSDQIRRRKLLMVFIFLSGVTTSCLFLYSPFSNPIFLFLMFFLTGMATSGGALTFPTITEQVEEHLHGTAMALNNSTIMGMSAILAPFASSIIQSHSKIPGVATTYHVIDFTKGLTICPILFLIAFCITLFCIKETYCRSQVTVHPIGKEK